MKTLFKLLLFITLIWSPEISKASHFVGGGMEYQCIGPNTFLVRFTLYRDCDGIGIGGNTQSIEFTSSCGQSFNQDLTLIPVVHDSQRLALQTCGTINYDSTNCGGGGIQAVEEYVYEGVVVLNPPCNSWTMAWNNCCRNSSITSIANPGGAGFSISASVNTATDSCNSSPSFPINGQGPLIIPIGCQNEPLTFNLNISDPDGDSLVYTFTDPLSAPGTPVTWIPPYSTTNQYPGITLDPLTGQIHIPSLNQPGAGPGSSIVVAIQICQYEYGTGLLLGCQFRDIQIKIVICNGVPPIDNGITNFTGDGHLIDSNTVGVCAGDHINFDVLFTDSILDLGNTEDDSITLTSTASSILPGATITFIPIGIGDSAICNIDWIVPNNIPTLSSFTITASDESCISPRSTVKAMSIVLSPSTYAGPDVSICEGVEWTTLTPTGGSVFSWSLLSGSPIDTVPTSPTYNMTCVNCTSPQVSPQITSTYVVTSNLSSTCQFMDTITVTAATNYSLTSGPDTVLCTVDSLDLWASPSLSGSYSYAWDNIMWVSNDTLQNPRTFSPTTTTYNVTATSADGCVKTSSNTIGKLPPVPNLIIDADPDNICELGDSVNLLLELNPNFPVTCAQTLVPCGNQGYTTDIYLDYNPADGTSGPVFPMGPTSLTPTPFGNSFKSSKQQFLYRANELQAMGLQQGMITEIGFFVTAINGTATYSNYSVKMGCTSLQSIPGSTFTTGLEQVFPSQTVNLTTGWNMLEFSTPYVWDGTTNLLVEICFDMRNSPATQNSIVRTRDYKASTPISQHKFNSLPATSNTLKMCPIYAGSPTGTNTIISTTRPDTRFTFCNGYDPLAYTYEWYPNQNISDTTIQDPIAWPDTTSTYNVILWDTFGVCSDTASIEISVANFDAGPDTLICSGDTIQLFPEVFDNCNTFNPVILWYPASPTGQVVSSGLNPMVKADSTTVFYCQYTNFCGCSVTDSMTVYVNQLEAPNLTLTGPTCTFADGQIMVQNNGGLSPFTYSIDGGITFHVDSVFTNLARGEYITQYMDSNGCLSNTRMDTLINPNTPVIDSIITNTPLCYATASGLIDIHFTGGQSPHSFSVDGGVTWGPNSQLTNQLAGTYVVYVRDVNSCISYPDTVTIASNVELLFDSLQFSNALCFEDSTGTINAFGHGGTPPYTYSVDSGYTYQSSYMFNTLAADTYHVIIMDSVGCTTVPYQQIILDGPEIIPTFNTENDTCYNACGGAASVSIVGGTPPFTYSWRKGVNIVGLNSSSISGLCAGTDYELTVVDTNGCTQFFPFVITQPDEIIASATAVNSTCFGASNGTITVSAVGGIPPYRYSIDNGSTFSLNPNFSGLPAGNYSIVVADSAMRCTGTTTAALIEPNQIELTTNITTAQVCVSGCIQLSANATGGTGGPYNYIWNQGFDSSATQLACPTQTTLYSVYAIDSAGCTSAPKVITLTLYDSIVANAGEDIDICPGESATLNPSATGGLNNIYNYQWTPVFGLDNGFAKNPIAKPATSTLYTVKITDNCATPAAYDSVWVNVHPNPTMDFFTNDSASGCEPFNIRLTNGSNPVQFSEWTITSEDHEINAHGFQVDLTDLEKGVYDVSLHVVTPQGCFGDITKTDFIEVFPLPTALFSMDPDPTTIYNTLIQFEDKSIGEIQAWQWDFASIGASNDQNPLYQLPADSGTFPITLLVTTDKLCEDEVTELLRIGGEYNMYIPNSFTPNGDGKNDVFAPRGLGVDPDGYSLKIYDRWGGLIFESNNLGQPWDGRYQGSTKMAPNGVYIWKIVAKDGTDDSDTHKYSGTINLLR